MLAAGWKQAILLAVEKHNNGDVENLELFAKHLEEVDNAKQHLRDKGYGWTGLGILKTVQHVPANNKMVENC